MGSAALISVEEYLRRTEKPNAEYIDGVVRVKPMPTGFHSLIELILVLLLRKQGLEALHEVTVRLSETSYLVPDVIAAHQLPAPYPTEPVLLCIEILSQDQRLGAMLAKCEQYHVWGVPYCWVIDPEKQSAWEYHAGKEPLRIDSQGTLAAGEIMVRLADVLSGSVPGLTQ